MTSPHSRGQLGARDLALVAVFVGIMAALGTVPALYPFGTAVPITAQSMGVMLAGGILGARRGGLSMLVFILLVAAGLPLLSGGRGGLSWFASPSAGFLVGFPVAAFLTGLIAEAGARRFSARGQGVVYTAGFGFVANVLGAIVALYAFGIVGLMIFADLGIDDAFTALWVFVPGDLVKAGLAAVVAAGVHRGYPGLLVRESDDKREPAAV
jgi:biotin transport system substrate-specific component